jgi:hypothetical protein
VLDKSKAALAQRMHASGESASTIAATRLVLVAQRSTEYSPSRRIRPGRVSSVRYTLVCAEVKRLARRAIDVGAVWTNIAIGMLTCRKQNVAHRKLRLASRPNPNSAENWMQGSEM